MIAAATFLPKEAVFNEGGVRIGAGTGNMGSASWGGGNGEGGPAPLMNTPSFNSRATAQMGFKALLKVLPDLPVDEMHRLTAAGQFDTGRDLAKFPTEKIEGKRIGRNPKTGTRVEVPAKRIPYFKPSKELKDLVNGGVDTGADDDDD